MTIHSTNADSSIQIVADIAHDIWLVKPAVEVTTAGTAIDATGPNGYKTFLIYGHLIASGGMGIELGQSGVPGSGYNSVIVYDYASIFGESFGVYSHVGTLSLYNEGSIQSLVSGAVVAHGGDSDITNLGTIASLYGTGAGFTGLNNHLTNSGSISGGTHGIYADGTTRVLNTGTITGVESGVTLIGNGNVLSNSGTIFADSIGVVMTGTGNSIDNSGVIQATYDDPGNIYGAVRFATAAGSVNTLTNTGEIHGADLAVQGRSGNETVINRGLIDGDVDLGLGNDLYDGLGGQVIGTIAGGGGNDVYRIGDANQLLVEFASGGTDTVEASVSFRLGSEFENLLLLGTLDSNGTGNAVANTLTGNLGDNRLSGGNGTDILLGADGADRLLGGNGNDTLQGGDGDDVLFGGSGRDVLTGGADDDRFLYRAAGDSTNANADRIADFTGGEDVVDLSAIDAKAGGAVNNAFTFIGAAGFSGLAGELRFQAGTVSSIEGDTTGDGLADFTILFTNGVTLTALDFIL